MPFKQAYLVHIARKTLKLSALN
uniref:Uncharacterized protein n=1 Tax=Rhizophora mucronata TaxID=61149 RepID=A0A2P2N478_RHIMU